MRSSLWLRVRLLIDRARAGVRRARASPALAVLMLLGRRHDGGPGLIRVPRVGRGGDTFGMLKIRSMRVDGADGRAAGVALTGTGDDRITPVGARLRRLHLDEIPQLYNVVRGEMCLLGPRPEAPEFVDLDDPAWQTVLDVPPGIAGPTQLVVGEWERTEIDRDRNGHTYSEVVVPVKLAIDRWYVQHATPRLDLNVLAGLARSVAGTGHLGRLGRVVSDSVPEAALPLAHAAERS